MRFLNVCVVWGWAVARGDESWGSKRGVRFQITEEEGILEIITCKIPNLTIPSPKSLINK